jgi:hypothetical protein
MKMTIIAGLMLSLPLVAQAEPDKAVLAAEGKGVIKGFVKDLKAELQKGMKSKGPVHTINVCQKVAPHIAEAHSQMSGWAVSRTSLKPRNQDNAPDSWETGVMKRFEERKAAGEEAKKLAYTEVVQERDGRYFRMMKAIPTAEVCTKCHGEKLNDKVVKELEATYPEDQAKGFNVGDLRGAFSLKKRL